MRVFVIFANFGEVHHYKFIVFNVNCLIVGGQNPLFVATGLNFVHIEQRPINIASHGTSLEVFAKLWIKSMKLKGGPVEGDQLICFHQKPHLLAHAKPKYVGFLCDFAENLKLEDLLGAWEQRSQHHVDDLFFVKSPIFQQLFQILTSFCSPSVALHFRYVYIFYNLLCLVNIFRVLCFVFILTLAFLCNYAFMYLFSHKLFWLYDVLGEGSMLGLLV